MGLFVRATKGKTTVHMPCPGAAETEIHIGDIHKKLEYKSPREDAESCKEQLERHGWTDVKIMGSDA